MAKKKKKVAVKGPDSVGTKQRPVHTEILVRPIHRGVNDIGSWRSALRLADLGNRTKLYDLFTDLLIDGYLSDAIDKRIDAVTDGESPRVTGQLPPAGTTVQAGFCAMLYVTGETAPQAQDYARVPDVLGLDMRESAQALRLDGFEMNAQGDGLAARQSPIGGSYAPEGTQVLVTFEMP